jgi:hypothetical protein
MRRALFAVFILLATASAQAADQVVSFGAYSYTFHENDGTGSVTVKRSGDPSVSFSVGYKAFINEVTTTGTITFAPNEMSKVLVVPIVNDNLFDSWGSNRQNYNVMLQSAPGVTVSGIAAPIYLIEDDPFPSITCANVTVAEGNNGPNNVHLPFTLSIGLKRADAIQFYVIVGGNVTRGSDYEDNGLWSAILPPGQKSGEVIVRVTGDNVPEPDETMTLGVDYAATWLAFPIVTILNDDYMPPAQQPRIHAGSTDSVSLSTTVPAPSMDHILLSSSDTKIASVQPFIDIPAGAVGGSFNVTGVSPGSAVITMKLPPSRSNATNTIPVEIFTVPTLQFDGGSTDTIVGESRTVTVTMDPHPAVPLLLPLTVGNPSVASVSSPTLTIGTNGIGSFSVLSMAPGVAIVMTQLPSYYGGATAGFYVSVAAPLLDTTAGPSSGGQRITIHATSLRGRCVATFDGVSGLNTTASSANYLTTSTPPHDAGIVDVGLQCGAEKTVFPGAYTYTSLPSRITTIYPSSGPSAGGILVTVNGDNLRRGRCSIWFGGKPATTISNDQTSAMLVATPSHEAGGVDVTMHCGNDLSTLGGTFLYTSDRLVTQLSGTFPGVAAPGDRVIVSGAGFRDDDEVFFDGVPGLDMVSTPTEHFITVPDLPPGNVAVTMRDNSGYTVPGPTLRMQAPASSQITSAPARVTASSEFSIIGAGFRPGAPFLLGGTPLETVVLTSTNATLRLPSSIGIGSYPFAMANQNTAPRTIQVENGLAVSSVSFPCSSTDGGPLITITGNGFVAGAVVSFGAADSTDVTVRDAHNIIARVPPSSGVGHETVKVTNPDGDSGALSNAFRYHWPDPGCIPSRRRPSR